MLFYDSPHLPHFKDVRFKKFIPDERDANFNPNNKEERINGFNAYKNSANYIDSLLINIFDEHIGCLKFDTKKLKFISIDDI